MTVAWASVLSPPPFATPQSCASCHPAVAWGQCSGMTPRTYPAKAAISASSEVGNTEQVRAVRNLEIVVRGVVVADHGHAVRSYCDRAELANVAAAVDSRCRRARA